MPTSSQLKQSSPGYFILLDLRVALEKDFCNMETTVLGNPKLEREEP